LANVLAAYLAIFDKACLPIKRKGLIDNMADSELFKVSFDSLNSVSNSLIMAWAVDKLTGRPRYILELDAAHRGGKCECVCPSCKLPLIAVNAAKTIFQKRPHFRHPDGAARDVCLIVAARKALEEMFAKQDKILLPRYRRSGVVEGLSGQYFNAWVEREAERVRAKQFMFRDEVSGWLILEDGRRLLVKLIGRGEPSGTDEDRVLAKIELEVDDPSIAMMSPEEIFQKIELSWSNACWIQHWEDEVLENEAQQLAKEKAINALDWLGDDGLLNHLNSSQRRETLLHREVKAILEAEKRICLPRLQVNAEFKRSNGFVDRREWIEPEQEVMLASVELEVHLGHSIPDVISSWMKEDGWTQTIIIEVTVTNTINDERIERLESFGFPVLEIDIGRMGGVVSKEEFKQLVVDEVAGKRWLYHPAIEEQRQYLVAMMQRDAQAHEDAQQKRNEYLDAPASEWAIKFLNAIKVRWSLVESLGESVKESQAWQSSQENIKEAIAALDMHGYELASMLDTYPLQRIVSRIASIFFNKGIEYKSDSAWLVINAIMCDRSEHAKKFHTLYLIAIKTYSPEMTRDQAYKVSEWRNKVKASILAGQQEYIRETTYDRLMGLLFPEMRVQLNNPFGTPLQILENYEDPSSELLLPPAKKLDNMHPELENVLLRGAAFDEWARKNPEAAKSWLASPAGKAHSEQNFLRNKKTKY
jgi:hypothetical protein